MALGRKYTACAARWIIHPFITASHNVFIVAFFQVSTNDLDHLNVRKGSIPGF